MSWVLISTDGTLEVVPGPPTRRALTVRVGDLELVPTGYATWVAIGEYSAPAGLHPNPVAGAMALLLNSPWRQYLGPVGFVGRLGPVRDEAVGPLDAHSLNAMLVMHRDVTRVLDIPAGSAGEVNDLVPADEIRKAAEFMRTGEATWL